MTTEDVVERVRLALIRANSPPDIARSVEMEIVARLQAAEYRAMTAERNAEFDEDGYWQ